MKRPTWNLDTPLLDITGESNHWTIGDSCMGVQIFGATGSGKTSGPIQSFAKTYLENQFGGVVFCVKPNDKKKWIALAKTTGREKDLLFISKSKFDFLKYESERVGEGSGQTENLINLFLQIVEVTTGSSNVNKDKYWDNAVKQLLRNSIDLCKLSGETISLNTLSEIIVSAPQSSEDLDDINWMKKSFCFELILKTEEKNLSEEDFLDYKLTKKFWTLDFPRHNPKTRSDINSVFTTLTDSFLRGEFRRRFCSGKVTIRPEMLEDGKILIVDMPVSEWDMLGRQAATIMKYIIQKSLERRKDYDTDYARPVFLFVDESQFFTTSYDIKFQSICRSARACVLYSTQNLPMYYAELGSGSENKVKALIGNLQTKIFCQNGDDVTNKWAAESIGREIVERIGTSKAVDGTMGDAKQTKSTSEQKDYMFDPHLFGSLKKGGKENNCIVESIFWQSGRRWKNDEIWFKIKFSQRFISQRTVNCKNISIPKYINIGSFVLLAYWSFKYIYLQESYAAHYIILNWFSQVNHVYIQGAVFVCLIACFYIVMKMTQYLKLILKMSFLSILYFIIFYLLAYSPFHNEIAINIGFYLCMYFTWKCLFAPGNISMNSKYIPTVIKTHGI